MSLAQSLNEVSMKKLFLLFLLLIVLPAKAVDTERSVNDLLTTLFQDGQSVGSITAQDMRDLIVSMQPAEGGMYISTSAETTISAVDTPTLITGTYTAVSGLHDFTVSAAGRVTYTGTNDRFVEVMCSISFTSASNNVIVAAHIAKNGTVVAQSEQQHKVGTGSDVGLMTFMAEIEMSTNDYVEPFIENKTGSGNLTAEFLNCGVIGFIE